MKSTIIFRPTAIYILAVYLEGSQYAEELFLITMPNGLL